MVSHQTPPLTAERIREIAGDLDDHAIVEILATGASATDLAHAVVHLTTEEVPTGPKGMPLSGPAIRVLDILRAATEQDEANKAPENSHHFGPGRAYKEV